jgi:hypothetical protein
MVGSHFWIQPCTAISPFTHLYRPLSWQSDKPSVVAMSNNEDKSLLEQLDEIAPLKQFDAFPKIPANYKSRTKFGGFMTIFVIALSFILVLNDIAEFIWGWSDYEFAVDTDNHRTLDINIDIIVNSPCGSQFILYLRVDTSLISFIALSIDLRDAVGDRLHLSDTFRRDGVSPQNYQLANGSSLVDSFRRRSSTRFQVSQQHVTLNTGT